MVLFCEKIHDVDVPVASVAEESLAVASNVFEAHLLIDMSCSFVKLEDREVDAVEVELIEAVA